MKIDFDRVENITWTMPKEADGYKTAVYLYIGQKQSGKPSLRWKIRYYGEDWLFITEYKIKIGVRDALTMLPTQEVKTRVGSSGGVWETFDEKADDHDDLLNLMLSGQSVTLRMQGTNGRKDVTLSEETLNGMRSVLMVYRYLGGQWSDS